MTQRFTKYRISVIVTLWTLSLSGKLDFSELTLIKVQVRKSPSQSPMLILITGAKLGIELNWIRLNHITLVQLARFARFAHFARFARFVLGTDKLQTIQTIQTVQIVQNVQNSFKESRWCQYNYSALVYVPCNPRKIKLFSQ